MVTATFGGLTRDVLSGRPGRILHSFEEIYATTALGGATAYVALHRLKAPAPVRILGGVGTVSLLFVKFPAFASCSVFWGNFQFLN